MPPSQLQIIANRTFRLHEVAKEMNNSLLGVKANHAGHFFLGMLRRQSILLHDAAEILGTGNKTQLMSAFILFRCLLDDFIVLLQLFNSGYSDEEIIKHSATAFSQKFNLLTKSKNINNKHFDGQEEGLVTDAYLKEQWDDFLGNPDNDIYFSNKDSRTFKSFTDATSIMVNLSADDDLAKLVSKANAHALILWKLLSTYVHFSTMTVLLEKGTESRDIEILQLNEVLSYVYKSLGLIQGGLKKIGIECEIKDNTGVIPEILHGFVKAEEAVK